MIALTSSATGQGARAGILVKNAEALERAEKLTVLALDKTGTLTCGQPQVTDTEVRGLTSAEALHLAAALEHNSEHPLARAIVAAHGDAVLGAVSGFKAVAGMGVEGVVDGRTLRLGSPVWLGLQDDAVVRRWQQAGKTVVALAEGGRTLALFAVADALRPTSKAAVARLRERGIRVVMLTGEAVLIDDSGETPVGPGDVLAFPAGEANGHHLHNRSDAPCTFVAISAGAREGDSGEYSDIDMVFDADGYARKDGTRYDARRTP